MSRIKCFKCNAKGSGTDKRSAEWDVAVDGFEVAHIYKCNRQWHAEFGRVFLSADTKAELLEGIVAHYDRLTEMFGPLKRPVTINR